MTHGFAAIHQFLDTQDWSAMTRGYEALPKTSIETAFTEKTPNVLAVKADFTWHDIGSWSSVAQLHQDQRVSSDQSEHLCAKEDVTVFLHGTKKPIATVGLNNISVIETDDAILILDNAHCQDVKQLHKHLKSVRPGLLWPCQIAVKVVW